MTGKGILEALSFVDEHYIEEAENGNIQSRSPFRYLLPLAACLCLVFAGVQLIPGDQYVPSEGNMEAAQVPGQMMDQVIADEQKDNSLAMGADIAPEGPEAPGMLEVPSVILRIEGWTDAGFTAVVDSLVDTDLIPTGTVVNVEMLPNLVVERIGDGLVFAERRMPTEADFPPGTRIRVMFRTYSPEDNLLQIESIRKEDD